MWKHWENKEKALVGAFSVIEKFDVSFAALILTFTILHFTFLTFHRFTPHKWNRSAPFRVQWSVEVVFHHYHHTININIVVPSFYPCWGHGGLGTNDCDNKIMMIDLLLLLCFVSPSSVLETEAETEWAEDWSRATLQTKYIAAQEGWPCSSMSILQTPKKSEIIVKSNFAPKKCLKILQYRVRNNQNEGPKFSSPKNVAKARGGRREVRWWGW